LQWKIKYTNTTDAVRIPINSIELDMVIENETDVGMYVKGSRFNTHSNRKAFAQNLYDSTKNYTKHQIKGLMSDYIQEQGSNQDQIKERINRELERVNKYRIKNGLAKRSFTREELRILYVSLMLGHSRMSIVKKNYIITEKMSKI
jgi:hypothetical protein